VWELDFKNQEVGFEYHPSKNFKQCFASKNFEKRGLKARADTHPKLEAKICFKEFF